MMPKMLVLRGATLSSNGGSPRPIIRSLIAAHRAVTIPKSTSHTPLGRPHLLLLFECLRVEEPSCLKSVSVGSQIHFFVCSK